MNLERKIDRYFRREDTLIAGVLKRVFPLEGSDYRHSNFKKRADAVMATPVLVAAVPVIVGLCAAVKIEDGAPCLYKQKRLGSKGEIIIDKIRCMVVGADKDKRRAYDDEVLKTGPHGDPRCTKVGRFMRQFELEELPQLWSVVKGEMALTDFRAVNTETIANYRQVWPDRMFKKWSEAYFAGRPGLFSLWAMARRSKDDRRRFHADILYAEKASLGLDLYIRFRTTAQIVKKFGGKFYDKIQNLFPKNDKSETWKDIRRQRIKSQGDPESEDRREE